jgi:hypothetical protein
MLGTCGLQFFCTIERLHESPTRSSAKHLWVMLMFLAPSNHHVILRCLARTSGDGSHTASARGREG